MALCWEYCFTQTNNSKKFIRLKFYYIFTLLKIHILLSTFRCYKYFQNWDFVNKHLTSQQTSHILNIPHPEHPTSRTSHIPNIPLPEHPICQTSHMPNIPHLEDPTFETSHILNIPHSKHSTSQTSHFPNISHPEHPTS